MVNSKGQFPSNHMLFYNYFKIGGQDMGDPGVVLEGTGSHKQMSGDDVTPLGERHRNAGAKVTLGAMWYPSQCAGTLTAAQGEHPREEGGNQL